MVREIYRVFDKEFFRSYNFLEKRMRERLNHGNRIELERTQNVQFWLRLDEKMTEKAEHRWLCEHFEGIFSFKLSQKWTLVGFNAIAMEVKQYEKETANQ